MTTTYDQDGNDVTQYCCIGDNHLYSTFNCPRCDATVCFACSVKVTDESKAEGRFICPECPCEGDYPEDFN